MKFEDQFWKQRCNIKLLWGTGFHQALPLFVKLTSG
jgi:hypothetical protein